jgi:hypothetical protein
MPYAPCKCRGSSDTDSQSRGAGMTQEHGASWSVSPFLLFPVSTEVFSTATTARPICAAEALVLPEIWLSKLFPALPSFHITRRGFFQIWRCMTDRIESKFSIGRTFISPDILFSFPSASHRALATQLLPISFLFLTSHRYLSDTHMYIDYFDCRQSRRWPGKWRLNSFSLCF